MRYIAETSPRVEWLRQALRQILFVFIPVCVIAMYVYEFQKTPYQYMHQDEMVFISLFIGVPVGAAVWLFYRIVRFAIGR